MPIVFSGLNPFLVRSAFYTSAPVDNTCDIVRGLNPFLVRSAFYTKSITTGPVADGLS